MNTKYVTRHIERCTFIVLAFVYIHWDLQSWELVKYTCSDHNVDAMWKPMNTLNFSCWFICLLLIYLEYMLTKQYNVVDQSHDVHISLGLTCIMIEVKCSFRNKIQRKGTCACDMNMQLELRIWLWVLLIFYAIWKLKEEELRRETFSFEIQRYLQCATTKFIKTSDVDIEMSNTDGITNSYYNNYVIQLGLLRS